MLQSAFEKTEYHKEATSLGREILDLKIKGKRERRRPKRCYDWLMVNFNENDLQECEKANR